MSDVSQHWLLMKSRPFSHGSVMVNTTAHDRVIYATNNKPYWSENKTHSSFLFNVFDSFNLSIISTKKKNVFFYRFPQHYSFIFFYRSIREHLWITNHLNVSPAKLHMNTWIPHNVDRSRKLLKLQLYKCHKKYKLKVKFIVLIKKWSLILNVLCIRDALNCHHN